MVLCLGVIFSMVGATKSVELLMGPGFQSFSGQEGEMDDRVAKIFKKVLTYIELSRR